MATADIEEHHSERDCEHILFSKQYCGQLIIKIVKIDIVVQKFIDSKTISEAERKSLRSKRIADQKLRHLLNIINENCNRNDLQAFKTFIDILEETCNVNVAQHLSLIYNEREHYVATLNLLSKEKSFVRNLKHEISRLERIVEEKEEYLKSLTYERNKLVYQKETFREEKLSLEEQIQKKEEDLLFVKKEIGELTRNKIDLESEAEHKSNVIRERSKDIVEKEQKMKEAIEESNRLRLKIDTLQQQHSEAMVKDREMSNKIEILENDIDEKENIIMNLRKNKTMTREEIEEEWRKITKAQMVLIEQQSEKIDFLVETQMASTKQQNEKIDFLTDAVMRALSIQEKK